MDDLDVQNLIEEIRNCGAEVDENGLITLYHNTSKTNADAIRKTGKMKAKEDGLFFSTKADGQISGYGDITLKFKIPANKVELDDIFSDEAHLRIPLKNRLQVVDISSYIQSV